MPKTPGGMKSPINTPLIGGVNPALKGGLDPRIASGIFSSSGGAGSSMDPDGVNGIGPSIAPNKSPMYIPGMTNMPSRPMLPVSAGMGQMGGVSSPGTRLSANPNNNFILQALGGMSPGFNPNYAGSAGTPISNTAAINSQKIPSMGNMAQSNPSTLDPSYYG